MKFQTMFFAAIMALSDFALADCLDNKTKVHAIEAKIKGMYVTKKWLYEDRDPQKKTDTDHHFVIFDKVSCQSTTSANDSQNNDIGKDTKEAGYLRFEDDDKFLQSILLMAYAQGDTVTFRLGKVSSDTNTILYVVYPSNAN